MKANIVCIQKYPTFYGKDTDNKQISAWFFIYFFILKSFWITFSNLHIWSPVQYWPVVISSLDIKKTMGNKQMGRIHVESWSCTVTKYFKGHDRRSVKANLKKQCGFTNFLSAFLCIVLVIKCSYIFAVFYILSYGWDSLI